MTEDNVELDYAFLAQNALRRVVRDVLSITEAMGAPPGDHHFYIEFVTHAEGVTISDALKAQYPDRITIVLQHQFDGLTVGDDAFSVTLFFSGVAEHLTVPYDAVTQFADPTVNFALQFEPVAQAELDASAEGSEAPADVESLADHQSNEDDEDQDDDPDPSPPGGTADVVSLDRFRKK